MAITNSCVRFLIWAKKQGVSFEKVLTLGHLENQTDKEIIDILSKKNPGLIDPEKINWQDFFADTVFSALGAISLESLDYSGYENASLKYDLNEPIPSSFYGQYSLIVDGGTLEHVFNFPQAIKNCMQALCMEGHFIGFSPANNLMGHGFYQFSPELFYRIFSEENGFKIKGLFLVAAGFEVDATSWYEVEDPKSLRERVTLTNCIPAYLMVVAKKVADTEPFNNRIFQSDYIIEWEKNNIQTSQPEITRNPTLFTRIARKIFNYPAKVENLEKINSRFFKKRNY